MSSFIDPWLADAKSAHAQTGVLTSVILAQWLDETANFSSRAFVSGNNYAGVSYSGVSSFPTKGRWPRCLLSCSCSTVAPPFVFGIGSCR
jgi:hypothetical protein